MRTLVAALAPVPAIVFVVACAEPAPPSQPPAASARAPASVPVVADAAAACAELRAIEDTDRSMAEARAAEGAAGAPSPWGESRVAHGTGVCSVADDNIQSLEDAILAAPEPVAATDAKRPGGRGAGGEPRYLDLVDRRFSFDARERALLAANGFVVAGRLTSPNYGAAFHEIYQSELPIFVTSDAILHAVYAGNDKLLSRIESSVLEPALRRAMAEMTCALPSAASDYPPEVARDLDVYLGVANALLRGDGNGGRDEAVPTPLSDGKEIAAIVGALGRAEGLLGAPESPPFVLFGRPRVVDASAFRPRGHYEAALRAYFQASMWLSRLELNLVSRSCKSSHPSTAPDPSETPREDVDALALADLAERSGALPLLAKVDHAWSLLAGRREDVSLSDLVALRAKAGIRSLAAPDVADQLRRAIGAGWKRTARTHFTPAGTTELPVIATALGPRIGPDTAPTKRLVEDAIPGRPMLHAADMAYVLGNDRAKTWLAKDLAEHAELGSQLELARADARAAMSGEDLYSLWMRGVVGLASPADGTTPSFMRTDAWADLRLDTTIAAFGQIRHNYVLMAAGTYDAFGCRIPDGYVEPAPGMLDAIIAYADRGASALRDLDPRDESRGAAYFARVAKVMRTLRRIVARELSGEPLREDERRFLGMVAEFAEDYRCFDSCAPPTYTGWWYDLFIDRIADGTGTPEFIADYYTSTNVGQIAYIGAREPHMGVFIVDAGGPPRAMVGPVAHAYEHVGALDQRITDSEASAVTDLVEPWAQSYTVAEPREPRLSVHEIPAPSPSGAARAAGAYPMDGSQPPARRRGAITLEAKSPSGLGPVTLELLDHHRKPIATLTHVVGASPVRYVFPARAIHGGPLEADGVRVRVGDAVFVHTGSLDVSLGETP
jgi:hypothetical protein